MIRLRCETGTRPREDIRWKAPPDVWLGVALSCARFQAYSLLTAGRRRVDLSKVQELHGELDLLMLYEAGILELLAWEEQGRTGVLTRVKCADLSEEAALALVAADVLPEALLTHLLAPDLLQQEADVPSPREMEALAQWSDYRFLPNPTKSYIRNYRNTSLQRPSRSAQYCYASV